MSAIDDDSEIEASRAPLLDHLVELRKRLIICIAALVVGFLACFFVTDEIFKILFRPYAIAHEVMAAQTSGAAHKDPFALLMAIIDLRHTPAATPEKLQFIYTAPLEIFFSKIKLAMFGATIVGFPVLAWQVYAFVAPGLYKRERHAFLPFLIAAPILFAMGAALVYFVMLPFILWFSLNQEISTATIQVHLLPKINDYMDLITKLVIGFGLCFQLPVVVTLCGMAGLISAQTLASGRRFALLGIIVISAIVTPPDMISPFLLAVPIYLLYEVSIWCVRLIEMRRKTEDAAQDIAPA